MMEYQKICIVCGDPFIAKQKNTRYCSKKCGQAAYRSGAKKSKVSRTEKITDEQLSQAIDCGLSRQEIADKYGMHVESISRRMQRLGKYATGDQFAGIRKYWGKKTENINKGKVFGVCWHYIKSHDDLTKEKHPDFVYLESRKKDGVKTVRLKCKKCNTVIERSDSTFRCKAIRCEKCKENQKLQDERIKLIRFFIALKKSKIPKICKECGNEYYSKVSNSLYCSQKCRTKHKRAGASIRSRCRHYGVYYDASVKSRLVFERDHYICQICGMATNSSDRSWGTLGPYSPTVDHILALANGGAHTWDNVQCAHAMCNSFKRDLLTV